MTRHRGFETATQGCAVNRGHDRLGAVLHLVNDLRQPGFFDRFIELGDIGAGNECATVAYQNRSFGIGIGCEALETAGEPLAYGQRKSVDGGIVDGNDGDIAIENVTDYLWHGSSSFLLWPCGDWTTAHGRNARLTQVN